MTAYDTGASYDCIIIRDTYLLDNGSALRRLEAHISVVCACSVSTLTRAYQVAFRHSRRRRCAINRFLHDKDMLHGGYYERAAGDKLKIGAKRNELRRVGCLPWKGRA